MNNQEILAILIQCTSANDLPAHTACILTKWLINCEVQPGGPYLPKALNGEATLAVNLHAVRLFSTKEHPLQGALHYIKSHQVKPLRTPPPHNDIHVKNTYTEIEEGILTTLGDIERITRPILAALKKSDTLGEISQLSSLLAASVATRPKIKDETLAALNQANVLVWCAYSLYDSAYDKTPTDTTLIPVANTVSREALQLYIEAGAYPELARDYLHRIDTAQLKELQLCRFSPGTLPTKSTIPSEEMLNSLLSEKSIAHCIGPLSIVQQSFSDDTYRRFTLFCNNYCKARQLLDDIHDWQADFIEGRWTYVTARLARLTYESDLDIPEILGRMKRLFWDTEANTLLEEVLRTITEAELLFLDHIKPHTTDFLDATLHPLKKAAIEHRKQIKNAKYFISNL